MANSKPAKPSPMGNLWAMVKDSAVVDHLGDVLIMAVHVPTIHNGSPLLYKKIVAAVYQIKQNKPDKIQHRYFLGSDPSKFLDYVQLWHDNEIMPSRLLFWFKPGSPVPYQCELAADRKIIATTIKTRRDLKAKGWLEKPHE